MADDAGNVKDDDTGGPPETPSKAAAAKAAWEAAKLEEESGPQKAQFLKWMNEWADEREKAKPKPKTAVGNQRPKSFLERMLDVGDAGA